MRTPIAHALAFPDRVASGVPSLSLADIARLTFEAPDLRRFPCLRLAFETLHRGGTAGALLNASNEVAVAAFLEGRIRFTAIAQVVEQVLDTVPVGEATSLEVVLEADRRARELATGIVAALPAPAFS